MNSYTTKMPFWPDPKGYRNIDFGLERVFELLKRLDNPHLKLPPTIHIAGTNGKGSTLSFLKAIFEESNLKVHSYTSPHLVHFNERIKLAGIEISDQFLNEILKECKAAAEIAPQIAVTFFEGITVAAFLAFSKVKADILLLETGMGGRLDATNVLETVLCSIITPISFDHTEFLGNSLSKIAFEKAGIIKKNCPSFIAKQKPTALKTIIKKAQEQNSNIKIFNQDWHIKKYKNYFIFEGFNQKIKFPLPSLAGKHQIDNAALAIACVINQKKFTIKTEDIACALQKTKWQARLQKITYGKFFEMLNQNCELYLDGSHNLQGAQTIASFLKGEKVKKKIIVIFAMLKDKDCYGFLKVISNQIDQLICLTIENEEKSRNASEINKIAQDLAIKSQIAANFEQAFAKISQIKEPTKVIICGSLYLAGSFLAQS